MKITICLDGQATTTIEIPERREPAAAQNTLWGGRDSSEQVLRGAYDAACARVATAEKVVATLTANMGERDRLYDEIVRAVLGERVLSFTHVDLLKRVQDVRTKALNYDELARIMGLHKGDGTPDIADVKRKALALAVTLPAAKRRPAKKRVR